MCKIGFIIDGNVSSMLLGFPGKLIIRQLFLIPAVCLETIDVSIIS